MEDNMFVAGVFMKFGQLSDMTVFSYVVENAFIKDLRNFHRDPVTGAKEPVRSYPYLIFLTHFTSIPTCPPRFSIRQISSPNWMSPMWHVQILIIPRTRPVETNEKWKMISTMWDSSCFEMSFQNRPPKINAVLSSAECGHRILDCTQARMHGSCCMYHCQSSESTNDVELHASWDKPFQHGYRLLR